LTMEVEFGLADHLTIGGHTHAASPTKPTETYDVGFYSVTEIRIYMAVPGLISYEILEEGETMYCTYSGEYFIRWSLGAERGRSV